MNVDRFENFKKLKGLNLEIERSISESILLERVVQTTLLCKEHVFQIILKNDRENEVKNRMEKRS